MHLHFGDIALLLSSPQLFDFSLFISGMVSQEDGAGQTSSFASLICASLPVTGFYIWYGRKYKKAKKEKTTEPNTYKPKAEAAGINS